VYRVLWAVFQGSLPSGAPTATILLAVAAVAGASVLL
jgi:hypothetical protein